MLALSIVRCYEVLRRLWHDGGIRAVHHGPQGQDHYLEELPRRRADDRVGDFQVIVLGVTEIKLQLCPAKSVSYFDAVVSPV